MRPVVTLSLLPRRDADIALVMPEVEIGLGAVVGHEDFAVLIRAHRAGIDIQIRVELAQPHLEAARLQQRPERRRAQPLAERGDHAAGDEDEPRHGPSAYRKQPARPRQAVLRPGLDPGIARQKPVVAVDQRADGSPRQRGARLRLARESPARAQRVPASRGRRAHPERTADSASAASSAPGRPGR